MDYHVFRKPIKGKSGRQVHRWYYYWLGADGKQYQKACRKCKTRQEAEDYIRTLPPIAGEGELSVTAMGQGVLIRDIARDMYRPGSAHMSRRKQLGKSIEPDTMLESRRYINKIVELWGDMPMAALSVDTVMPYLFGLERSGKWKNRFIEILGEVYSEAPWYDCRILKPAFSRFAANSKKSDIFTTAELDRLFKPENFPDYQLYLFFLLCLSGGMRLGECRAVRAKQIIQEKKVLIIDGFCKKNGTRTIYNKTGSPDNPKFRLVYLPENTLDKIGVWIDEKRIAPESFCFTMDGDRPLRQEYTERVFYRALQSAGIIPRKEPVKRAVNGKGRQKQSRVKIAPPDGRRLVPHSLRYTYVSRMRRELSAADLLPMTGHSTEVMVDYYNRKVLDLALAALPPAAQAAADTLFT
jgi:integrase